MNFKPSFVYYEANILYLILCTFEINVIASWMIQRKCTCTPFIKELHIYLYNKTTSIPELFLCLKAFGHFHHIINPISFMLNGVSSLVV